MEEEEGGSGVVKGSAAGYVEDAEEQIAARVWVWTREKKLPSPSSPSLVNEWAWQWTRNLTSKQR